MYEPVSLFRSLADGAPTKTLNGVIPSLFYYLGD
jgi:hypothetical protein